MHHADPTITLPDPYDKPEFYSWLPIKRAIAWLLDVAFMVILATIIFVLTIIPVLLSFLGVFLLPVMITFFGFFYRWITLSTGSATWGMRVMAIQIRETDGSRLTAGTALLHTLGYTICVSTGILQFASMVMMLLTDRKQGLPDMVLGTTAINRPAGNW